MSFSQYEAQQGNLLRCFCVIEAEKSSKDVLPAMENFSRMCSLNHKLLSVDGQKVMFVAGTHLSDRVYCRSALSVEDIFSRAAYLLESGIGTTVMDSPAFLENNKIEYTGNSGVCIVDKKTGLMFVFNCGFQFVILTTVVAPREGSFFCYRDSAVIEVSDEDVPVYEMSKMSSSVRMLRYTKKEASLRKRKVA